MLSTGVEEVYGYDNKADKYYWGHCLQATNTIGYIAMSGATLRELADLLGHVNVQMTMRYAHLMPSHTQNVVARMMQKFLMDTPCEAGDER